MSFFISEAFAEGAAPITSPIGGDSLISWVMPLAFVAIFYFLIWRPQSKRAKEHSSLMNGIEKGDEIVINGGMLGKVTKVTDDYVIVEVANNVELRVQKHAVTATLPKGTIKAI